MRSVYKILPSSIVILLFLLVLSTPAEGIGGHFGREGDHTPRPVLISPTTETVTLTGEKELVFKWSPHEGQRGMRAYYDLRLYEGYETLEKTLILKEKIDPRIYEFRISADKFTDGKIYTWSLRQAYDGMHKSDRSIASFMVIKK